MTQTMTKPTRKQPVRIMFITARYFFKAGTMAGSVCYGVRSIKTVKGQEVTNNYQCFIHTDGTVSCNCESRKALCCHALFVSEIENERDSHEAEQEAEVDAVLAELDTLATPEQQPAELLAAVNSELAKVQAEAATQEEFAATRARAALPNDADQIAYFIQLRRRSDEMARKDAEWKRTQDERIAQVLKPIPTPTERNVSESWLLKGSRSGAFSGRVA